LSTYGIVCSMDVRVYDMIVHFWDSHDF
jgi:hypothetical protein